MNCENKINNKIPGVGSFFSAYTQPTPPTPNKRNTGNHYLTLFLIKKVFKVLEKVFRNLFLIYYMTEKIENNEREVIYIYSSYTPKQAERCKQYRQDPTKKEILNTIRRRHYEKMKNDPEFIANHQKRSREYYHKKKLEKLENKNNLVF